MGARSSLYSGEINLSEEKKEKNIKVGDLVCFRLSNPTHQNAPLWKYVRERRPAPGIVIAIFSFSALDSNKSEDDKILFLKIRWTSGLITEEEIAHIHLFRDCYEQEKREEERERARQWKEMQTTWKGEED